MRKVVVLSLIALAVVGGVAVATNIAQADANSFAGIEVFCPPGM